MEEGAAEDFVVGFFSLPTEILQIIIEYLPIQSVVRLSLLCKTFQALAEDANLWKSRLKELLKTTELAPENVPLVPSPAGWKYHYYLEASNKAKKCFPCKTRGLARPGHDFPVLNRKYFLCNDCSRPVMRSRKIKEYLLTPKETADIFPKTRYMKIPDIHIYSFAVGKHGGPSALKRKIQQYEEKKKKQEERWGRALEGAGVPKSVYELFPQRSSSVKRLQRNVKAAKQTAVNLEKRRASLQKTLKESNIDWDLLVEEPTVFNYLFNPEEEECKDDEKEKEGDGGGEAKVVASIQQAVMRRYLRLKELEADVATESNLKESGSVLLRYACLPTAIREYIFGVEHMTKYSTWELKAFLKYYANEKCLRDAVTFMGGTFPILSPRSKHSPPDEKKIWSFIHGQLKKQLALVAKIAIQLSWKQRMVGEGELQKLAASLKAEEGASEDKLDGESEDDVSSPVASSSDSESDPSKERSSSSSSSDESESEDENDGGKKRKRGTPKKKKKAQPTTKKRKTGEGASERGKGSGRGRGRGRGKSMTHLS